MQYTEKMKRDASSQNVQLTNLIVWLIGFIVYRMWMHVDLPVGNTLPDMAITMLVCVVASKVGKER